MVWLLFSRSQPSPKRRSSPLINRIVNQPATPVSIQDINAEFPHINASPGTSLNRTTFLTANESLRTVKSFLPVNCGYVMNRMKREKSMPLEGLQHKE